MDLTNIESMQVEALPQTDTAVTTVYGDSRAETVCCNEPADRRVLCTAVRERDAGIGLT